MSCCAVLLEHECVLEGEVMADSPSIVLFVKLNEDRDFAVFLLHRLFQALVEVEGAGIYEVDLVKVGINWAR